MPPGCGQEFNTWSRRQWHARQLMSDTRCPNMRVMHAACQDTVIAATLVPARGYYRCRCSCSGGRRCRTATCTRPCSHTPVVAGKHPKLFSGRCSQGIGGWYGLFGAAGLNRLSLLSPAVSH